MLDIKFIRQNQDLVKKKLKNRGVDPLIITQILDLDEKKRKIQFEIEAKKAKQNKINKEISTLKEGDKKKKTKEMQNFKKEIKKLENDLNNFEIQFKELMYYLPNLPQDDVPEGKDEKDNVVIYEVGEKPKFDFQPKDYLILGQKLNLINTERASKIAGSRFGYLIGDAVLLEFALIKLAYDTLMSIGFIPIIPPVFIKPEIMKGLGYLEKIAEDIYFIEKDNLYLVATSEHSVVSMHKDEIFDEKDLPKRYLSFSTCFRREAGSYGKDTKGILRVHQFDKVEMVSFTKPENSKKEHEFLLNCEEKLMQALKLPYRVMKICTGDMGNPAAAQFDIETWLPGQNQYRETHSTSNTTDFQSRRLNIKYRNSKTKKLELVHILNGTAFAIGRMIIAILENYQQKDGSIIVPEALRKYVGKEAMK